MLFCGFGEGKKLEAGTYYWNGKDFVKQKPYKPSSELTIIKDEPEFISRNAFPETVKWTGRRSKKELMKKYNCVDFRDVKGVGKERDKRLKEMRKRSPWVNTEVRNISRREVQEKRERRRKTHFTGYRIAG